MTHKRVGIESELEREKRIMDKLLEKDDYSILKNSMVNGMSSSEAQKNGWESMWKGVGHSIDKCLEKM